MSARTPKRFLFALLGTCALLAPGRTDDGIEDFVIGNRYRAWEDWGTLDAIDSEALSGWIQPRRTTSEVNILEELHRNGHLYASQKPSSSSGYTPGEDARIWSLNIPVTENENLLRLADGLSDTLAFDYFDRTSSNSGVSIVVDLGIPFPVDEIGFYPLSFGSHIERYVRGYELYVSDGSPDNVDERNEPIFSLLDAVPTNVDVVVRNRRFPPQHIRYLKLKVTSPEAFELDQLEVRGEGFVRRAVFTSQVFDAGDIANFGRILWAAEEDPGSRLSLQSRIRRVDGDDWTPWSPPYEIPGQEVFTTGPGQFVQLRATLETSVTEASARVDSISFEFSRRVMARRVLGQIQPAETDLGAERRFTYVVNADLDAADLGFDKVDLQTPAWASLQEVRISDRVLPTSAYAVESTKNALSVHLLESEDRIRSSDDVLELVFDCSVLIYGTVFGGHVSASWEADLLPQLIEEENAGDLAVQGSERSLGLVLGETAAVPGVFTPNHDGINDRTAIVFRVSQVIGHAPLKVQVYDLAGRLKATLADMPTESDSFRLEWDGRDDSGETVPPGLYVYRVELAGDVGAFYRTGAVGVAY